MQHEHTDHIAAAPDAVYAAIADVSNLPRFVPQMTAARRSEGDRVEIAARYEGREQHGEVSFRADDGDRKIEWSAPSGYHGWLQVQPRCWSSVAWHGRSIIQRDQYVLLLSSFPGAWAT